MVRPIEEILRERGKRYGSFKDNAELCQKLKITLTEYGGSTLSASQYEALDMIMFKVSRIVNGDADYVDNWEDIGGYAQLVAQELHHQQQETV